MALDDYDDLISQAAAQYNVDPRLLKSMMSVESGGDPNMRTLATLPDGTKTEAQGVMQFLPSTAAEYKVDPFKPQSAIPGAAQYLSKLLDQYGSPDIALEHYSGASPGYGKKVLAAYNAIPPLAALPAAAPSTTDDSGAWWTQMVHRPNFADKQPAVLGAGANFNPNNATWQGQNLVRVPVPGGGSVQVNKMAADSFSGFLGNLADLGYPMPDVEGFNPRAKTGGGGLSAHAYGNAIDIDPNDNPYSNAGKLVTNLPQDVSRLAAKWGLTWGGDWDSPKDPMHFEWAGVNPTTGMDYRGGLPGTRLAAAPTQGPTSVASTNDLPPDEQAILQGKPVPAPAPAPAPSPSPAPQTAPDISGLPPEEQKAFAATAPAPTPAPGPTPTPPLVPGDWAGARLVRGVEQGVRDVGQTINNVDAYLQDKIPGYSALDSAIGYTPEAAAKTRAQEAADTAAYERENPSNLSAAGAGRLAGNLLATAPVAGAARLVGAGAEALPYVGNLLTRPAEWAMAGGLQNLLTGGGATPQDWERDLATGAAGGAALGGVAGTVGRSLLGAGRTAASDIADRLGIDLSRGQVGGTSPAGWAEAASAAFPGSGAGKFAGQQRQQIAQVIAKEAGIPGDVGQIDTNVLNDAKQRVGNAMENAAQNITVPSTPLVPALSTIENAATLAGPGTQQAHVFRNLSDQLMNIAANNSGDIPGSEFQKFIARGGPLDTALGSSVPEVRSVANGVRSALLNAAQGSTQASADALKDLAQARYQYKVLKTVEPAITRTAGGTEEMSFPGLAQNIRNSFDMNQTGAGANMQDLSRLLSGPLKSLPSSGTSERSLWQSILSGGAELGGAGAAAGSVMAGIPHLAPVIAALTSTPALVGRYLRFGPGLGIPGAAQVGGIVNPLLPRVAGGAVGGNLPDIYNRLTGQVPEAPGRP